MKCPGCKGEKSAKETCIACWGKGEVDENAHHWSGWPGAYCMKCGSEDPNEIAVADGMFDMDGDQAEGTGLKWLGTPEQKEALDKANVCSVKGHLVWSKEKADFELIKPPEASAEDFDECKKCGEHHAPSRCPAKD